MINTANESSVADVLILLVHYGFEIIDYTLEELIEKWLINHKIIWIRLAVIEALYQGRYKAISVEQILNIWQKKGNASYHFTQDFERLICKDITQASTFITQVITEENCAEINNYEQENEKELINKNIDNNQNILPISDINFDNLEEEIDREIIITNPEIQTVKNLTNNKEINSISQAEGEENLLNYDTIKENYNKSSVIFLDDPFPKQPIHKFVPPLDSSEFFARLKELMEDEENLVTEED